MTTMHFDFSRALQLLKQGTLVTRASWNNAAFLSLAPQIVMNPQVEGAAQDVRISYTEHIIMVQAEAAMPWTPSNVELMANDWQETVLQAAQHNAAPSVDSVEMGTPSAGHV